MVIILNKKQKAFMSYKKLTSILVIYTVLMLLSGLVSAQNYGSEEEVKKQAQKLYEEDQFAKAMPLYSQLLSLYPKDPNYNYKYGVCILFAGADKEKPIAFLEFASKKPEAVDNEVFYYLGRAYHVNYRFGDAIGAYNVYKKKANAKFLTKLKVDRQIEMCNNGLELLKNVKDLVVMQKKDLTMSEYFRAYDLGLIDSKLIVKPDDFKTSTDKKKKEESVLVTNPEASDLYISSYGDNDKNGKEIFRIKKNPNGEFSKPQNLGTVINTSYDEDYPYYNEKKKTLYFCSKGHNSIGGYDVFKSVYNEESQEWSNPVNMDFPISSPDDDLLYIPDTSNEVAYFSSRRGSIDGNIGVYKIKVGRLPVTTALIKGKFYTTDDEGVHPKSKITVKNASNNKLVGVFNSSEKTGTYIVNVPSGAKYLFTVETNGFTAQSALVDIPEQQTIRPLKQKINMKKENGMDKLNIYNNFDDFTMDEESFQAGIALIREKANLDVNYSEELENSLVKEGDENKEKENVVDNSSNASDNTNALNNSSEENNNSKDGTIGKNLTNEDLVKMAKNDAKDAQREADAAQDQSDEAFTYSNIKNEESQNKAKQAEEIKQAANSISDPMQKQAELDKANQLEKESKLSAQQAIVSYNLAKDLEANADQKQKEAKDADKYANDLDVAVKSNSKESIIKLNEQQAAIEKEDTKKSSIDNASVLLQQQSDAKRKEAQKDSKKAEELENQVKDMDIEAADLKKQADASKDEQVKDALLNQLAELNDDKKQRQEQSVKLKSDAVKLNREADELQQQSEIIGQVVSNLNNTPDNASKEMAEADKQKLAKQIAAYESQNGKQETANKDNANSKTDNSSSNQLMDNSANNQSNKNNTANNNEKAANTDAKNANLDNNKSSNATENNSNADNSNVTAVYENKIVEANKNPNEIERERTKAQVNKQRADAIDKDIAALETKLKGTKDKNEKDAIKADIDKLKEEQTQKRSDALESMANANRLAMEKEENGDANANAQNQSANQNNQTAANTNSKEKIDSNSTANANKQNGNENKSATNSDVTNKTENNGTANANNESNTASSDYNVNYQKQLDDVNLAKITELEKEKKIAEVNTKWAESLSTDIKTLNEQAKASSDKTEKAELKSKVKELEKVEKEKQELADAGNKKVKSLEKEQAKDKDKNGGNQVADYNSNYTTQLEEADAISDATAKENKKIELNEQWAKAIDAALIKQKELLEKTKKKKDKEEIAKRIADLETQKEEKITAVDESKENLAELKRTAAIDEQSKAESKSKTVSTNSSKYALPEASEQAMIAEEQFKQATDYKKLSDSLKLEAQNSKVPQEKFDMYNQSQALAKQAQVRNVKAYGTLSDANQLQYKNNASVIADMAKSTENNDDASRAAVINTEADYYNNEAAKLRTSAAASPDDVEKEKMLKRVAEYEKTALDKQASAYEIYKNVATAVLADNTQNTGQNKSDKNADVVNVVKDNNQLTNKEEPIVNKEQPTNNEQPIANKEQPAAKKEEPATNNQQKATNKEQPTSNEQPIANKELPIAIGTTNKEQPVTNNNLSEDEYNSVIKSSDYVNYTLLKSDADKSKQESAAQRKQADNFKTQAENDKRSSQELLGFAATTGDTSKAAEALRKSQVYDASSKRNLQQSDSTNLLAETAEKQAKSKNDDADQYLTQLDAPTANKIKLAETYKEKNVLADNSNNKNTATDNAVNANNKQTDNSSVKENQANNTSNEGNSAANNSNTSNANANSNTNVNNAANTKANSSNAPVVSTSQVVNENNELTQEVVFEKKTVPAYSKKNPIPINDKLPKGLVFKVQIGAFRNPIPQELFKDFAPVMGETTASGITRYTAGIFKTFDAANGVRKEINGIGYKDAFVVAYCNGKRINIEEAKAMIRDGRDCNGQAIAVSKQLASNTNPPSNTNNAAANTNTSNENSNTVTQPVNNSNQPVVELKSNTDETKGEAAAVTFEQVKGLVYTVQVGVYGKPVKPSQLFNIQPLYFEKNSNGYYRYSSGIFNSEAIATTAKNNVVGYGVKDAFVTAYYNGKRITPGEARKLIEQNGNGVFVNYSTINQMPNNTNSSTKIVGFDSNINNNQVSKKEEPVITPPEKKEPVVEQPVVEKKVEEKKVEENIPKPDSVKTEKVVDTAAAPKSAFINGVVYKVNIGEYNKEVPNNVAAIYFEIADKGVEHYQTSSGTTIYTVGAYADFATANATKEEVIEKGLDEAFVVAYKNGKQIIIDEAKSLTGGK